MKQAGPLQYSISFASLIIIAAIYFAMRPFSAHLLSPPPSFYIPFAMIIAVVIAISNSITLLSNIPFKLIRRLGTIFLLAITLYAVGESGRGFYAKSAFEGSLKTHTEQWMAISGKGDAISLMSLQRNRRVSLDATPEAVAALSGIGACVTVAIERAESGAERIAIGQGAITRADIKQCGNASVRGSASPAPVLASENGVDNESRASIPQFDEALVPEQEEAEEPPFKWGQPAIDNSK